MRHIDHRRMGRSELGWLSSYFHFSFAEYYNPRNMQFGVLRVFNDDVIQPKTGFDLHPHRDMEIITYIVRGELSHTDSMGNAQRLTRGQVQYMSAGTGVYHSEHNMSDEELRLMQIWIIPDKRGVKPNYGDYRFKLEERYDRWLPIATGYGNKNNAAPIKIHQDINAYAAIMSAGSTLEFEASAGRQAYLVCMEGRANVGAVALFERDALEISQEGIRIGSEDGCHLFVLEMEYDGTPVF